MIYSKSVNNFSDSINRYLDLLDLDDIVTYQILSKSLLIMLSSSTIFKSSFFNFSHLTYFNLLNLKSNYLIISRPLHSRNHDYRNYYFLCYFILFFKFGADLNVKVSTT